MLALLTHPEDYPAIAFQSLQTQLLENEQVTCEIMGENAE
jgi:hypothetical protein